MTSLCKLCHLAFFEIATSKKKTCQKYLRSNILHQFYSTTRTEGHPDLPIQFQNRHKYVVVNLSSFVMRPGNDVLTQLFSNVARYIQSTSRKYQTSMMSESIKLLLVNFWGVRRTVGNIETFWRISKPRFTHYLGPKSIFLEI